MFENWYSNLKSIACSTVCVVYKVVTIPVKVVGTVGNKFFPSSWKTSTEYRKIEAFNSKMSKCFDRLREIGKLDKLFINFRDPLEKKICDLMKRCKDPNNKFVKEDFDNYYNEILSFCENLNAIESVFIKNNDIQLEYLYGDYPCKIDKCLNKINLHLIDINEKSKFIVSRLNLDLYNYEKKSKELKISIVYLEKLFNKIFELMDLWLDEYIKFFGKTWSTMEGNFASKSFECIKDSCTWIGRSGYNFKETEESYKYFKNNTLNLIKISIKDRFKNIYECIEYQNKVYKTVDNVYYPIVGGENDKISIEITKQDNSKVTINRSLRNNSVQFITQFINDLNNLLNDDGISVFIPSDVDELEGYNLLGPYLIFVGNSNIKSFAILRSTTMWRFINLANVKNESVKNSINRRCYVASNSYYNDEYFNKKKEEEFFRRLKNIEDYLGAYSDCFL